MATGNEKSVNFSIRRQHVISMNGEIYNVMTLTESIFFRVLKTFSQGHTVQPTIKEADQIEADHKFTFPEGALLPGIAGKLGILFIKLAFTQENMGLDETEGHYFVCFSKSFLLILSHDSSSLLVFYGAWKVQLKVGFRGYKK